MAIDMKKFLLTGTAIMAVSAFAGPAQAAAIELDGSAVVNGTGINNADTLVDAVVDADDALDVDLDGTALSLGADGTVTGIDTSTVGTAAAVNFTNTSTTAATTTVFDDGADSIISGAALTITLGEDSAGGDALGATNMTVTGAVDGSVGGIDFVLNGFDGNTLTFNDNVDLGTGTIQMNGDDDTVVFAGTVGPQGVSGAIDGGADGEGNLSVTNTAGTVTFNDNIGGTFDLRTFTQADDTTVNTLGLLAAQTITIGANATLNADADIVGDVILGAGATLDAATAVNGDVTLGSGSLFEMNNVVVGDINGPGTLDVVTGAAVTGSIGATTALTAITVATGQTLTINAGAADRTVDAASTALGGAGSAIAFTLGHDVAFDGPITTSGPGVGLLTFSGAAGTVTFGADVGTSVNTLLSATFTDNAAVSGLTTSDDLFINTITLGENDTLTLLGNAQTVSGDVATAASTKGAVVVGNADTATVTFGGTVDAGTFTVGAGSTANISNDVSTDAAIGLDMNGTLNITSDGAAVTVATATGDADIDGTVSVAGDDDVTISAIGDLFIDGTLTTALSDSTKALNLTGATIAIGADSNTTINAGNQIILGGDTTFGDAVTPRTTTLNIVKTADFNPDGTVLVDGSGLFVGVAAGSTLNVSVGSSSAALVDGDQITVIGNAGGATDLAAALTAGDIVLVDTGFLNLEDDTSTATDLNVIVSINAAEDVVSSNYVDVANSLIGFAAATGALADARGNLLSAPTAEDATTIAESLSPVVDGGAVVGALNVSNRVVGLTNTRLAALRDGDASTGIAAGNQASGMRGWAQGFGMTAEQDRRDGIDGYDADTYGLAVGADGETTSGGHIGVALSYGNTEVDSAAGFGAATDVDSYQISLYGDMPVSRAMYVEGMAAYAWNDIDSTRYNVGGTGLNANAAYDADQFTLYTEMGRDFVQGGGLTVTPFGLAHWTHYNADDYTETGAGTANLNVDSDSLNIFELGVGVDAAWDIKNRNGSSLKPVLSAGARYDLVGDEVATTSTFTGGGAAFGTQGMTPGRTTLNLGAGVGYSTTDNWELSAEYDYEYKADYNGHSAQARAAYHF